MSCRKEQLQKRGFLVQVIDAEFETIPFDKKIALLESKIATERTLGARLLKSYKNKETVAQLIAALKVEKQLYPKIEICNSLVYLNKIAVKPLIQCLGKIGNNQHKKVPDKKFLKDSYPLPRDIASRTLVRFGKNALPDLLKELKTANRITLSELIDAIGHINFYSKSNTVFKPLLTCYYHNKSDDLIQWKIIRACSGINESENFLNELSNAVQNERLKSEIERSLRLIKKARLNLHNRT